MSSYSIYSPSPVLGCDASKGQAFFAPITTTLQATPKGEADKTKELQLTPVIPTFLGLYDGNGTTQAVAANTADANWCTLTLEDFMKGPLPPRKSHCYRIACQISQELCNLHKNSMLSYRLQPSSVYIDNNGNAKLGGLAVPFQQVLPAGRGAGAEMRVDHSNLFTAPELLSSYLAAHDSRKAEIHSLGVLLYWMFSRANENDLFPGVQTVEELLMRKQCDPLFPSRPATMNQDLWEFINQCCSSNPDQRPEDTTIEGRLSQLAVRDCLHSKTAQFTWAACTSSGFSDTVLLALFAKQCEAEIRANADMADAAKGMPSTGAPDKTQYSAILQQAVGRLLPSTAQGMITIEDFDTLSMLFVHFWCNKQALLEMWDEVQGQWFVCSELEALHLLMPQKSGMAFVVRPSPNMQAQRPFIINRAYEKPVGIERLVVKQNVVFVCKLAPGRLFRSLTKLVDYLIKLGYKPARSTVDE